MNKKMWKNKKIKNKLILQCISDGTWEWDIKEGKFYPSTGWKNIIGYDDENEEDEDFWFGLVHNDDRKLIIEGLKSYFKKNSLKYEQEFRFKTKSGGYRWFLIKGRAIWNDEKRAEYMAGICIDITDRKLAEERLKISEERYRRVVELSPNGVFVHDTGIITFVNDTAVRLLRGNSKDDIIGRQICDFMHQSSQEVALDIVKSDLSLVSSMSTKEQVWSTLEGEAVNIEITTMPIPFDEKNMLLSITSDLTERKKAELELKTAMQINENLLREAIEYDKLKTEFFSNISHELKTPLNIILGAIQLLELIHKNTDESSCACYSTFNKYIHSMKQNCFRLLRLINNLLDITRLDSGFISMNLKNYNIVSIVEDITLSVAAYLESKDINLVFDTEVEEKLIACDADKIERIILNLLSNSVKFTRPGGIINVNIYEKEESIQISVKDDGIGIPEDKLQVIFERFRQVDSTLTRAAEGSGIGLSLVKAIVEAHGGTIWVISELGKGSEFIIELPSRIIDSDMIYSTENTTQEKVERISVEFSDIYS